MNMESERGMSPREATIARTVKRTTPRVCRGYLKFPDTYLGMHNQLNALAAALAVAAAANATLVLPNVHTNVVWHEGFNLRPICPKPGYVDKSCDHLMPMEKILNVPELLNGIGEKVCLITQKAHAALSNTSKVITISKADFRLDADYWQGLGEGILRKNGTLSVGEPTGYEKKARLLTPKQWEDYSTVLHTMLRSLAPATEFRAITEKLVTFMKMSSPNGRYIGLHLRIEKDVHIYHRITNRGFVPSTDDIMKFLIAQNISGLCDCHSIYVATCAGKKSWAHILTRGGQLKPYTKYDVIPTLNKLIRHREVLSMIEAEVLARSDVFVGFETSSMSHFAKLRVLMRGGRSYDYRAPRECQNRLCHRELKFFYNWIKLPPNTTLSLRNEEAK